MADKKIQDLPLLSEADFNSATDFIIVERGGGQGTYKMPVNQAFSSSGADIFLQSQSVAFSFRSAPQTLDFQANNLLSSTTALQLTVSVKSTGAGRYTAQTIGSGSTTIFTKAPESTLFEPVGFSLGGSQSVVLHRFTNEQSSKSNRFVEYSMAVNSSNTNLLRLGFTQVETLGSNRQYHIGAEVSITATVHATIF